MARPRTHLVDALLASLPWRHKVQLKVTRQEQNRGQVTMGYGNGIAAFQDVLWDADGCNAYLCQPTIASPIAVRRASMPISSVCFNVYLLFGQVEIQHVAAKVIFLLKRYTQGAKGLVHHLLNAGFPAVQMGTLARAEACVSGFGADALKRFCATFTGELHPITLSLIFAFSRAVASVLPGQRRWNLIHLAADLANKGNAWRDAQARFAPIGSSLALTRAILACVGKERRSFIFFTAYLTTTLKTSIRSSTLDSFVLTCRRAVSTAPLLEGRWRRWEFFATLLTCASLPGLAPNAFAFACLLVARARTVFLALLYGLKGFTADGARLGSEALGAPCTSSRAIFCMGPVVREWLLALTADMSESHTKTLLTRATLTFREVGRVALGTTLVSRRPIGYSPLSLYHAQAVP